MDDEIIGNFCEETTFGDICFFLAFIALIVRNYLSLNQLF